MREVVVARVGVAAAAVRVPLGHGEIVVALDGAHAGVAQQREHAIGMRAAAAEVAETEDGVHLAPADVGQRGRQRVRVAVHAAEHGDAAKRARLAQRRHALRQLEPVCQQTRQAG